MFKKNNDRLFPQCLCHIIKNTYRFRILDYKFEFMRSENIIVIIPSAQTLRSI